MPTFTQSASVHISDQEKLSSVRDYLREIGRDAIRVTIHTLEVVTVMRGYSPFFLLSEENYPLFIRGVSDNIDCGTNIPMFMALAALWEDTDYMQWFVCQKDKDDDKSFIKCTAESITEWYHLRWHYLVRKATPAEIVEHFKE